MSSQQAGGKEDAGLTDSGRSAAAEDALSVLEPMETDGFSALLAGAGGLGWPGQAFLGSARPAVTLLMEELGQAQLQEVPGQARPQAVASGPALLQAASRAAATGPALLQAGLWAVVPARPWLEVPPMSVADGQARLQVLPPSLGHGRLQLPRGALQPVGNSPAPHPRAQERQSTVADGDFRNGILLCLLLSGQIRGLLKKLVMHALTLDALLLRAVVLLVDAKVLVVDVHKGHWWFLLHRPLHPTPLTSLIQGI